MRGASIDGVLSSFAQPTESAQPTKSPLRIERPDDPGQVSSALNRAQGPAVRNAHDASLLTYDDDECIGEFGQFDGTHVPGTELGPQL